MIGPSAPVSPFIHERMGGSHNPVWNRSLSAESKIIARSGRLFSPDVKIFPVKPITKPLVERILDLKPIGSELIRIDQKGGRAMPQKVQELPVIWQRQKESPQEEKTIKNKLTESEIKSKNSEAKISQTPEPQRAESPTVLKKAAVLNQLSDEKKAVTQKIARMAEEKNTREQAATLSLALGMPTKHAEILINQIKLQVKNPDASEASNQKLSENKFSAKVKTGDGVIGRTMIPAEIQVDNQVSVIRVNPQKTERPAITKILLGEKFLPAPQIDVRTETSRSVLDKIIEVRVENPRPLIASLQELAKKSHIRLKAEIYDDSRLRISVIESEDLLAKDGEDEKNLKRTKSLIAILDEATFQRRNQLFIEAAFKAVEEKNRKDEQPTSLSGEEILQFLPPQEQDISLVSEILKDNKHNRVFGLDGSYLESLKMIKRMPELSLEGIEQRLKQINFENIPVALAYSPYSRMARIKEVEKVVYPNKMVSFWQALHP